MKNKINYFFLFFAFVFSISCGRHKQPDILLLPGKGIVYYKDSVLLDKTNINDLCKILKEGYKIDSSVIMWDGWDSKEQCLSSGLDKYIDLKYKNFVFCYHNSDSASSLCQIIISTDSSENNKTGTENSEIFIGMPLSQFYENNPSLKDTLIEGNWINLEGISLILHEFKMGRIIKEIRIQKK